MVFLIPRKSSPFVVADFLNAKLYQPVNYQASYMSHHVKNCCVISLSMHPRPCQPSHSHLSQAPVVDTWYLPRTISKNIHFEKYKSKHYFLHENQFVYLLCLLCYIFIYFPKIIHTAHGSWSFYPWVTTANKHVTDWHYWQNRNLEFETTIHVVISYTIHGGLVYLPTFGCF